MKKKLNCLIIGYGSIGKRHAINFYKLNCNVFIWSINKKKVNKNFKFVSDLNEYINICDFCVICSPTNNHYKYIKLCLDYKKNIYLEKPITNNNKEIKKIEKHRNFKKIIIQVGCHLRSDPLVIKLKEIVESKQLGNLLTYRSYVGQNLNLWRAKNAKSYYSAYKNKGGGVHWDLIHDLDLAYYIMNDYEILYGVKSKISNITHDSEDYSTVILKFYKSKALGNITMDLLNPKFSRFVELIFEKGGAYWDDDLKELSIKTINRNKQLTKRIKSKLTRNDIFIRHASNFIKCLNSSKHKLKCEFNDFKKVNYYIDDIRNLKS